MKMDEDREMNTELQQEYLTQLHVEKQISNLKVTGASSKPKDSCIWTNQSTGMTGHRGSSDQDYNLTGGLSGSVGVQIPATGGQTASRDERSRGVFLDPIDRVSIPLLAEFSHPREIVGIRGTARSRQSSRRSGDSGEEEIGDSVL